MHSLRSAFAPADVQAPSAKLDLMPLEVTDFRSYSSWSTRSGYHDLVVWQDAMVGYDDLVLLVVTSLARAGPDRIVYARNDHRGGAHEESGGLRGPLFGRMRLDDCGKLCKRRLFGAVTLRKQCLGTFRRIESFSDRFKA
jgi:hypothetical protein